MSFEIKRGNYTIKLDDPEIYVNHEKSGRSGHMSHAMTEFAPGKIIDFNSNCSGAIHEGHSTFGWIEYRISEDGGETFSESRDFPYAKKHFLDGTHTVAVEKAVTCDNGRIVTFCLLNDIHTICEPWIDPPVVVTSDDGGNKWSNEKKVFTHCGRIYDALYRDGVIYVVQFCNDATVSFFGNKEEHVYRIYTSRDHGENFEEISVVPADTMGRSYATLFFDAKDTLHMYTYNVNDEHNPDHYVSEDFGKTWACAGTCYLAKGSRNMQTALIDGVFVLHCRGEELNRNKLALYTSEDGYHWDEGAFVDSTEHNTCFYSNNLIIKDNNGKNRLLIQYSHSYIRKCVNIKHIWLTVER